MAPTVATSLEAIEKELTAFFGAIVGPGFPVRNERSAGPRPQPPFLSFLLTLQEGTPFPSKSLSDDGMGGLNETVEDAVYLSVHLNVYGAGSIGLLNKIRILAYSMQRQWDTKLAFGNCGFGQIQNTSTQFLDGSWQVQASVIWTISAVLSETVPADWFNEATYDIAADQTEGFGEGSFGVGSFGETEQTGEIITIAAPGRTV